MSLLIDGYNLIFGTSVESRGRGGALERMRNGLIEFLASQIDRTKFKTITVVYDAANAPIGLASYFEKQGIKVHFARDHRDADELLEELIAASHAPGRLTVVSSDHRVQRAAKRRGATAVDSQVWFAEQRANSLRKAKVKEAKPAGPLTAGETSAWVQFFGPVDLPELEAARAPGAPTARVDAKAELHQLAAPERKKKRRKPNAAAFEKDLNVNLANPFPPGYAEDLFE